MNSCHPKNGHNNCFVAIIHVNNNNKSVFSFLYQLVTWHSLHLLLHAMLWHSCCWLPTRQPCNNWLIGTNLIHGEKCVISQNVSENMPNFMENSRKEFKKFTENSWAAQTSFRSAMLSKLRNLSNRTFEISEQRIFTTYINTKSRLKTFQQAGWSSVVECK